MADGERDSLQRPWSTPPSEDGSQGREQRRHGVAGQHRSAPSAGGDSNGAKSDRCSRWRGTGSTDVDDQTLCITADLTRRMSDPEAPETLPITVEGRTAEGGPCTVESDEVAAGEHESTYIALDGPSSVALRDGSGRIVFQRPAERQEVSPGEGEEGDLPYGGSEPAVAHLAAGTITVECAPVGGNVTTAELRVVPARTSALSQPPG